MKKMKSITYGIKKCSEAIAKGNLHNGCVGVWVLIDDDFRDRNCVGVAVVSILFEQVNEHEESTLQTQNQDHEREVPREQWRTMLEEQMMLVKVKICTQKKKKKNTK